MIMQYYKINLEMNKSILEFEWGYSNFMLLFFSRISISNKMAQSYVKLGSKRKKDIQSYTESEVLKLWIRSESLLSTFCWWFTRLTLGRVKTFYEVLSNNFNFKLRPIFSPNIQKLFYFHLYSKFEIFVSNYTKIYL